MAPKSRRSKRTSMRSKVKNRAQERESTAGAGWMNIDGDVEFFNPKKGRNTFDILPYEVTVDNHPEVAAGELWYQRTVWIHYGIGAEEKSYICPLKTIGKKCPICEHRAQLMKDPDADEDAIKDLKPRERELFNVRHDDTIKLFTFSYHLFGKQLEEEVREGSDEYAGFADLEDGYTLKVRFSEKKFGGNKFLEASRIDFTQKDDEDESVLNDVFNLDEILHILSYKDLEKVYWELAEQESEDKREPDKSDKDEGTECPEGLVIGKDFDQYDCCDNCNCRDECDTSTKPKSKEKVKSKPKPKPKEKSKPKPEPKEEEICTECPEKDLTFGEDFDQYECCDTCPCTAECAEAIINEEEPKPEEEKAAEVEEGECPYGHEFGADCNDYEDCDECESWESCQDNKDQLEAAGTKKKAADKKSTPAKKKKPIKKKK